MPYYHADLWFIQPQVTEVLERAGIENLEFYPSLETALEAIGGKLFNNVTTLILVAYPPFHNEHVSMACVVVVVKLA